MRNGGLEEQRDVVGESIGKIRTRERNGTRWNFRHNGKERHGEKYHFEREREEMKDINPGRKSRTQNIALQHQSETSTHLLWYGLIVGRRSDDREQTVPHPPRTQVVTTEKSEQLFQRRLQRERVIFICILLRQDKCGLRCSSIFKIFF